MKMKYARAARVIHVIAAGEQMNNKMEDKC